MVSAIPHSHIKYCNQHAICQTDAEWLPAMCLLFISRINAMTPQHAPPGGVPIKAGVNTVLTDATKRVEVRRTGTK